MSISNTSDSDQQLWEEIRQDSREAFEALYKRHWKRVYKTALYYLKDKSLSEQLLNEVFVVLWEGRKNLNIENIPSYLFITCKYQVFKLQKRERNNPIDYVEAVDEDVLQCNNTALDAMSLDDLKEELCATMVHLPKRCRDIFWMSRVKQLSNEEIANHFNISRRTVENQITTASRYLRSKGL